MRKRNRRVQHVWILLNFSKEQQVISVHASRRGAEIELQRSDKFIGDLGIIKKTVKGAEILEHTPELFDNLDVVIIHKGKHE